MIKPIDSITKKYIKVLDCGVGSGSIGQYLTMYSSKKITMHGNEIYEPYIKNKEMKTTIKADHSAYSKIIIGNYCKLLPKMKDKQYDVVIFGDSLEHVHADWAEHALAEALRVARYFVIVNMPVVPLDQGSEYGNEMETHRLKWNGSQLKYWGAEKIGGSQTVQCFVFDKKMISDWKDLPLTKEKQGDKGNKFNDAGEKIN
jgi:ubiquinone/menaquinone biosynthesis C-methylase UbiE